MPATPFVSGAVPIFVGYYASGPIVSGATIAAPAELLFLGHTENGLDIQFEHKFDPYRVDLGGSVEADKSYQGTTATITATLSRWDDAAYQSLVAPPVIIGASGMGGDVPGGIGTLMVQEGAAQQVIALFPYQAKTAYAAQVAGLRFFACTLEQDNWKALGTRPRLLSLSWRANRVFVPGITNAFGYGGWVLFDSNMTGLPAVS